MDRKLAREIREHLMNHFSWIEKVRFRNGEIHAYGLVPSCGIRMWAFRGYVQDAEICGLNSLL